MYFLVFFIHLCRKSLSKALLTASFRGVSVRRSVELPGSTHRVARFYG